MNYTVTDNCTAPAGIVCDLPVASNEPSDGTGDGHTSSDWQILDEHHVLLRAERAGSGSGRIYTETVTCTDSKGNASSASVPVTVPHNRR